MKLIEQLYAGSRPAPDQLLNELSKVFPLIRQLKATPQEPEWHAEGDVRIHTECVIAEEYGVLEHEGADLGIDDQVVLILGAALHDIGKALTTREEEREGKLRIVSPHHTERGRSYLAPCLPVLGLKPEVAQGVLGLVGHHHAPKSLVKRDAPAAAYFRLARSVEVRLVYLMELADLRGREMAGPDDAFETLELFRLGAEEAEVWNLADPYAAWRDIIAAEVGEGEVNYVVDSAIHAFEAGLIFTPQEAIARTYEWRSQHPEVVVACGPSGSGKSTWIEEHCPEYERISLDDIREEVTGKRHSQARNGEVMQRAKARLREHLRAKKRIVWDATSIRRDGRAMVVDLGHDYHAATKIVGFATPPELAKARNRQRARTIPTEVLERQYDRLQWPEVWEAHRIEVVNGAS